MLGFVWGLLRYVGSLRASVQGEVEDCPGNLILKTHPLLQSTDNSILVRMNEVLTSHRRELDSHEPVLLGTLMVVGLLVTLCLVKEPPLAST